MTPYERVRTAFNHKTPDRVPCDFSASEKVLENLKNYFGVSTKEEILRIFKIDKRVVPPKYIGPPLKEFPDGSHEIIVSGGPHWKKIDDAGFTESCVYFPWSDIDKREDLFDRYGWNGKLEWWDFSNIKEDIEKLEREDEYWIAAHGDPSGLQHLCMWVGDEKFYSILASDEDLAFAMIEQHNKYRLEYALKVLEAGNGRINELMGGGDYGAQEGLLISKNMFNKYFKELYRKFYSEIKKNFDVEIFFHCCGSVVDLIPDLIELGVTILDPIQTSARGMDIESLKSNFGDKLNFHGAIDIQQFLPYATPDEVKKEVERVINVLGRDGGYMLSPGHAIQIDTPIENIITMYETATNQKIN
ncbi:MAG TPA: uroporphyrinogen decarboxylase family protein [Ignavibacteria bacterium]